MNSYDPQSNGVYVTAGSRITVANTGVYNIQFSAQFDKTDSGRDDVEIWLSKNGTNVPDTSTIVADDGNNAKFVAAWNFVVPMNANDYVELKWYSDDLDMRLLARTAGTNPIRPAIPSVIATVTQVTYNQLPQLSVAQQTTGYILTISDAGRVLDMNTASARSVRIPTNSSVPFPVGTQITVLQTGTGQISITADAGVTLNSKNSYLNLSGQWAEARLLQRNTNLWIVTGDLTS